VDGVALFKPVTYDLFADLGDAWGAYKPIYDPKTQTTPAQRRRLMDLAKLVTHACDADFAAQIGQFIDLEEFARFLACEAMLSNYDGILSNGQNFLLYLDPRTERFGFIPWDLDHCWGEFPMIGTIEQREQASLWHPWVGTNHFLARTIQVPAFRERYRSELQRLRTTLFVPERLSRRVDDLAVVVRPFIREESTSRLEKFEFSVADQRAKDERPREGDSKNPGPPGFALKRFFVKRAAAVDDQLAGRSDGVVPPRTMRK
jgi:spore coat protein H